MFVALRTAVVMQDPAMVSWGARLEALSHVIGVAERALDDIENGADARHPANMHDASV